MKTRKELLQEIHDERAAWQALLAEIGGDRMEEPGPMGDWTFKDLTAHLLAWSERTMARIEAGPGGNPPPPWPASMGTEDEIEDWDEVNAWLYEQQRERPLPDVLADMDRWFVRLAALIETMPEDTLMIPGRSGIEGMEERALVDAEFFGHFYDEHEASVRAWLQSR
ncbi:MAG TPA: maleylpyruvate isomerase N-terminal domain-containing protein [Thermomicrobiales bacterium]|nr:maleylpyruvate isomerase N-terminal domain-containing protein [Thermomicrobiales bacterium]